MLRRRAGFDKKKLLQGFFGYFERLKPRLVSFNGRGFDLPVLKYRAMMHGVSVPWLYGAGDNWNSYQSRYSTDWHCDLLDVLSDYSASARASLHKVSAADRMTSRTIWKDMAHVVFNLKEFIYLP